MGANFSYSKVDTFKQCGFKYFLQYEAGYYCFSESIATEFGTLIHSTEEAIAKAIKEKQPIDYISLKNKIIRSAYCLDYKYPKDYRTQDSKSNRTYKDKVYEYLEHGIYRLERFMQEHPSYEIVGIEQSFKTTFAGKPFKGFIDRVFFDRETNRYLIQDIKTYAKPVEDKDLTTPLQFVVYVLAAQELYGCKPEDCFCQYDLPLCNLVQDAGTKGFFDRGTKKLTELLGEIDARQFKPNPTPLCHWCPYAEGTTAVASDPNMQYLCPYHSLWTPEKKNFAVANKWEGFEKNDEICKKHKLKRG